MLRRMKCCLHHRKFYRILRFNLCEKRTGFGAAPAYFTVTMTVHFCVSGFYLVRNVSQIVPNGNKMRRRCCHYLFHKMRVHNRNVALAPTLFCPDFWTKSRSRCFRLERPLCMKMSAISFSSYAANLPAMAKASCNGFITYCRTFQCSVTMYV